MYQQFARLGLCLSSVFLAAAYAEPGKAVYGPLVEKGEAEFELVYGQFTGGAEDGGWAMLAEANYGVTDWWMAEVQFEFEREPGENAILEAIEFENVFAFNTSRAWPVQFGAALAYEFGLRDKPDEVEAMLIAERHSGPMRLRGNLITERQVGSGAEDEFEFGYAAQLLYALNDDVSLGAEGYGGAGSDEEFADFADEAHYWGPVAQFELPDFGGGESEIQIGYLAGFGETEADGYIQLKLELEY
ncbi:MAG: hypothetical protein GYB49_05175 [Alphaproteobacteria bacterium]|nr:hypothetical protein [Hyphomonas sp.]MBR9806597.1 hypothetical protein [Alphaproteobacteria bacterium]|tara:strand:- start:2077 stop:2811 length:735 start_codon:yes stop_codon:yes gene_type:complete